MEKQSDQKRMLRCILRDVLRNLWVAAALALSLSFFALIGARISYAPSYTSSATFAVFQSSGLSSAYANMAQTQSMIETFRTILGSDLLRRRVSEDMGLDRIPGTVSVETVPETNLVTLSVTAPRPDQAFEMLRSVARVYPEVGEKALGTVTMEVFRHPRIPDHPDNPFSVSRVMQGAFAVGFVLSTGLMAAGFYLRDTVKTSDQVREKLDTQLFETIYHEHPYKNVKDFLRRRRKSMLLNDPAVSFLYEETIKKITTKLLYRLRHADAKVVLITATGHGEGTSTIAMNLAQDLSHRKKRVLLIEGNLKEPGLARVLRVDGRKNIPSWGKYLQRNQDPTEAICGVGSYSFPVLLNQQPIPEATELLSAAALPGWLREWKQETDVIIIDGPPVQRRSDAEVWARCADLSLLVVRQNRTEAKYINDSIDMLEQYGSGLLGCIYNDAIKEREYVSTGYDHYGRYGGYGHYGHYGPYGSYGKYGKYDRTDGSDD